MGFWELCIRRPIVTSPSSSAIITSKSLLRWTLRFLWSCVYTCVGVRARGLCIRVWVCTPEANLRYHLPCSFESGSLSGLGLADYTRLAGQQALGIHNRATSMSHHTLPLSQMTQGLNSRTLACTPLFTSSPTHPSFLSSLTRSCSPAELKFVILLFLSPEGRL